MEENEIEEILEEFRKEHNDAYDDLKELVEDKI